MVEPSVSFGPLDYLVFGLFGLLLLALGFSARLRSNSMLQFLAAGRRLTFPLFVASLVTLWYGDVLGVGESVSSFGFGSWVLFGVPYYIFAVVYAFGFAKRIREAKQLSIPERLHGHFGKAAGVLGACLIFLLAVPASHALALGVILQSLTGWHLIACLATGAGIAGSFLYKGGLLADARASTVAFVMMYSGFALMAVWCLTHHPINITLSQLTDKNLLKWDGGTGWLYVLSLWLLGAWTLVDPGFHQRVASAESVSVGKAGVLVSAGFWFLFDALSTVVGLYALVLNPNASGLQVFPSFAERILPPGLKGIFFCGMVGGIVSAMVGYALVSGTTVGREIIARLRPDIGERAAIAWSRIGIAFAFMVAIALAASIRSIVDLWTSWAGAIIGALLIPVCASYLSGTRRLRPRAVVASMPCAFAVALCWMVYGMSHGNDFLEVVFLRTEAGIRVVMPNSKASAAEQEKLASGSKMAIGTLLPGLLTSAIVIALGTGLAKRGRKDA